MKILCIEKNDKYSKIKELLNTVTYENNKIIINSDLSKTNLKNKIKIIKKIKKIILKEKVDKVLLSDYIKKDAEFLNLLYSNEFNIANDRWLFKMLTCHVVEKIIMPENKSKLEVWITVNDIDNITKNIILKLANEFKRVNIITNHIRKFKNIEEKLYEEDGIMITVTNNRRKSLLKANLIVNIDFPKELLNQFAIFDQAIIVNLEGNMSIKKKRFCGRIINDIIIKSYEDEQIEKFIKDNSLEKYDIRDICNILDTIPNKLKFELV